MEKFEIGLAASVCHDFLWYDFCDWYIELSKPALYSENEKLKSDTVSVLVYVLSQALKLLHPVIPFITEEIFDHIPGNEGKSIMIEEFPKYNSRFGYRKDKAAAETVMAIIKGLRNLRAQVNAPVSKKVDLYVVTEDRKLLTRTASYIEKLAGVNTISFIESKADIKEKVLSFVLAGFEIYVPLGELVDVEKELARLKAELEKIDGEIAFSEGKLNNPGFAAKAPKAVVDKERERLSANLAIKEKLASTIAEYEN